MVTKLHRDAVLADLQHVKAMLSKTEARNPLGAISLKSRLRSLEKQLEEMDAEPRTLAQVALIFDGMPVNGSSSISADFAGQALKEYQELITSQLAATAAVQLGKRGPLSDALKKQAQMNITGLVHGSFGFVLEEGNSDQRSMWASPTRTALQGVTDLLSALAASDARGFEKRLADLDARMFHSLSRFINTLYRASSTLKLSEDQRELGLGLGDVERAHERISRFDVSETEETLTGELLGILPIRRRFEFRPEGRDVLVGRVAASLSADFLERIEREGLVAGRGWVAHIHTKEVVRREGAKSTVTHTLLDLREP